MKQVVRCIMLGVAWLCFAAGCIGVFVPVLPTTPLLLLATFLFARFSPRMHDWICSTRIYREYVAVFKDAGGMHVGAKARMLAISYTVLGISAFMVDLSHVRLILLVVAAFLLWLVAIRIPTITKERAMEVRRRAQDRASA